MTRSMTGFARREAQGEWGELVWELRSVNHRYLDVTPRLPETLRALEPAIREKAGVYVGRGKVEITARLTAASGDRSIEIDTDRLAALSAAVDSVRAATIDCRAPDALRLLTFPGVQREIEPDTEALQAAALESLDAALADLREMRAAEGGRLADMLTTRAKAIREHAAAVRLRIPQVRAEQADKLRARLAEMNIEADPARVETELVMAAQRMDVAEELDRLEAHIEALQQALTRAEPIGRRLDFLMQEFNREANTLGSKSADAEVTGHAVEIKVLIEQMREQVQNIE
ncbi:YicC/YloC family endoribonuclease [Salinisphaera sp.]|uniref:YicC/YloC family endoribonuclease n=1 Tax=Salinisphaera sp. TaxID=1914330 RepID=UPI002D777B8D|nr:YicC/YloC family endoribonuclease [Salinisphaera sp.]HET7314036.1 YicC/YloC family endoribonuclease [Salinisphaera sp.]